MKKILLSMSVTSMVLLNAGCPGPSNEYGYEWDYPLAVTAEGYYSMQIEPNVMLLSVVVSADAGSYEGSLGEVGALADSVSEICLRAGMSVNRSEVYTEVAASWSDYNYSFTGPEEYHSAIDLTISAEDFETLNALIPEMFEAGAVSAQPLGYMVQEDQSVRQILIDGAMQDSERNAQLLAASSEMVLDEMQQMGVSFVTGTEELFLSREECLLTTAVQVTWTLAQPETEQL